MGLTNILNLPNLISVARIFLVPIIGYTLLAEEFFLSFLLFVVAGVSDFLDGWLARLQKIQTELGAYLDPLADKLLMSTVYITLGVLGHIPLWLVLLVLFRDLLIIGAIILAWMIEKPLNISPLWISKLNTVMQLLLVTFLLADLGLLLSLTPFYIYFFVIVAITTLLSTFGYLLVWFKAVSSDD